MREEQIARAKELAGNIKILAFDLDDTLLGPGGKLTPGVKEALSRAISAGLQVVPTTGRAFSTVPEEVINFPGVKYAISSNGAHVIDLASGESIYKDFISPEKIDMVWPWLLDPETMVEIFFDHLVFAEKRCLDNMEAYGKFNPVSQEYTRRTRRPVDDVLALLRENIDRIENINLHYADNDKKVRIRTELQALPGLTVVSSTPTNIEIGNGTVSKGHGIQMLAELLGYSLENVMAFGDSHNDTSMILAAGVGVAMENGEEEVKAIADLIAPPNREDGVAWVIENILGY